MKALFSVLLVVSTLAIAPNAHAGPVSSCASDFSSCSVFEDGLVLQLPGLAIAGDLILTDTSERREGQRRFPDFQRFLRYGRGHGTRDDRFPVQ